jgi:hypothetical protein
MARMTLSSNTLLAKISGTDDMMISPFDRQNKKTRTPGQCPKDVLVSDAAILLPAERIVNRQFAKKRKNLEKRFFVKISLRQH